MFRTSWFNRGKITSDEGFSVSFGSDWVVYEESGRKMTLTVDVGAGGATIFEETANRWNDDLPTVVDDVVRRRIVANVKNALESQGFAVRLLP